MARHWNPRSAAVCIALRQNHSRKARDSNWLSGRNSLDERVYHERAALQPSRSLLNQRIWPISFDPSPAAGSLLSPLFVRDDRMLSVDHLVQIFDRHEGGGIFAQHDIFQLR